MSEDQGLREELVNLRAELEALKAEYDSYDEKYAVLRRNFKAAYEEFDQLRKDIQKERDNEDN